MREHGAQARRVVDDLVRQLDRRVVSVGGADGVVGLARAERLAAPVGAAGGRVELFAPDQLHATGAGGEGADLAGCDGGVELSEEGGGEGLLLRFEGLAGLTELTFFAGFLCWAGVPLFW